ncbi:MAG: 16S rRNA (guanine(966)-N(2))-methyltransferase RsmD [Actinomycetes bacterium]
MTRIIAGQAKGRRLLVPAKGTRPTSDRVRESLFNTLTSELLADDRPWSTLSVLDLYAGSGALGIEAASRGAQPVLLVEKARLAAEVIRKNIDLVGLPGLQLLSAGVAELLSRTPSVAFTLVFADPPYDVPAGSLRELLNSLVETGWVAPLARVVVERPTSDPEAPLPETWIDFSQRRYGDTTLWYGRATNTTGE